MNEPTPEKIDNQPEAIPLDVLYEDEDLIVINKPAGLVVHPGAGHREHTLVNALLHYCPKLSGIGGKKKPRIVDLLGKESNRCVGGAKTDGAHEGSVDQIGRPEVAKSYLAR